MTSSIPLHTKKCVPCEGGIPPLSTDAERDLLSKIKGWKINAEGHLEKIFIFPDFKEAMKFANKVAEIAEQEGHHPDLHISWGKCRVEIWTYKIKGLAESDFILAAKIDQIR